MQGFKILCIATCVFFVLDVLEAKPELVEDVQAHTGAPVQDKKKGNDYLSTAREGVQKATSYMGNVAGNIRNKMTTKSENTENRDENVKSAKPIPWPLSKRFAQAKNTVKTNLQGSASRLGSGYNKTKESGGALLQRMRETVPVAKGKAKKEEVITQLPVQ